MTASYFTGIHTKDCQSAGRENEHDVQSIFAVCGGTIVRPSMRSGVTSRLPNDFRQVSEAVTLGIPLTASSNNPLVGRYRDLAARLMSARQKRNPVPIRHSLSAKNSDTSRFARILSVLCVSEGSLRFLCSLRFSSESCVLSLLARFCDARFKSSRLRRPMPPC